MAVPASEAVDSSAAALVSAFDVLSAFDELEELLSEQPAITAHDIISETRSAVIFFIKIPLSEILINYYCYITYTQNYNIFHK